MKTRFVLVLASCVTLITAAASAAPPVGPGVTEVIVLDVGANLEKFNELARRVQAITTKLQVPSKARYWIEEWGSGPPHVIVTLEYPSLVVMAESIAKMRASPEFLKWQADAQASGIKQLSSSVVSELHP